jgi:hypothetical protein
MLAESTGIGSDRSLKPVYRDLDVLAGTWSAAEAAAFDKALAEQRSIDPELWK